MAIAADPVPRGPVLAKLNYYQPPADGSKPHNWTEKPVDAPQRNFSDDTREVTIHDIRGDESAYTLDKDAFFVVRDVPPSAETSFTSDDSIRTNYYPELEALLLAHIPGAQRIYIFDHTIRRASPSAPRAPVMRVHIDQTPASVAQRVRHHLPADADALLAGRYRLVNVWRPLTARPLESFPLAFASSATLADDDVVPVEHRYPGGYRGETAAIRYSPAQRWHYLSGMTGSERLLLECFDSEALKEGSAVQGGRLAHTAFEDPRTRADAEGRESIEVRALVFGP